MKWLDFIFLGDKIDVVLSFLRVKILVGDVGGGGGVGALVISHLR